MIRTLIASASVLALAACGAQQAGAPPAADQTAETAAPQAAQIGAWGVDLTAMDTSVDPGDDFFRYVNGAWMDQFDIPADKSRYGVFDILRDRSEEQVRAIIEELAAADLAEDDPKRRIGALYNAYMDTAAIEAKGLAPAQPWLDRIAAASTPEDIARLFGATGFASPVGGYVWIDSKDPENYVFYLGQSGLGMPDRDYYLRDDGKFPLQRAAYEDLLASVLSAAGHADAAGAAERIVALETKIAEAHWTRAESRDRTKTYNPSTPGEVAALAPDFPWDAMLDEMGIAGQGKLVLTQNTAIEALMQMADDVAVDDWKDYLTARFLISRSDVLPAAIDDAVFDFYGRTLSGQPEQRERWKRAVSAVEGALGESVGEIYVQRHFPPRAKEEMEVLVANLKAAFAQRLETLDWMGEDTKEEARRKLAGFNTKIGYPESFETYEGLVIGDDAFANDMAVSEWRYQDDIARLGEPVDRTEWGMTPQTVNAYYSPTLNEIVFPAAILQPPFFDPNADPAVNYGGIGGVIGHEIGHGFDDQGRRSDGAGVLRDWWTPDDDARFKARTDNLVEQYNAFCPVDGLCVNGRLSLGENIGDLGGLSVSYTAYKNSLNGEEAPVLDGFTGDQRFFLGWGQVWRGKYREDALRQQLVRGPHSPPEFRVNGVVRNMDPWYAAFDVTEDDTKFLAPDTRVSIW